MNGIWYKKPAQNSKDAFPLGNGRLGAKVYGNFEHEIIELNEESIWSKPFADRNNSSAAASLKEIRSLIALNRIQEAQELIYETFTGLPENQAYYKSAGALHIDFYDSESYGLNSPDGKRIRSEESVSFYKRDLDFENGIATAVITRETVAPSTEDLSKNTNGSSITYTMESFIPSNEDVMVVHISASTPNSIFLRAGLECREGYRKYGLGEDTVCLESITGVPFASMVMASAVNGNVKVNGGNLVVERADEVYIYVDVETGYRKSHYFSKCGDVHKKPASLAAWCSDRALKKICLAANENFQTLKRLHVQENSGVFKKISLKLTEEEVKLCAEDLAAKKDSPEFLQVFWNYSRYLYSSSTKQPGTLPSLKNGIWLSEEEAAKSTERYSFDSLKSEYVAGYKVGLKRCGYDFAQMYRRLFKHGRHTAQKMYGINGCVIHGTTDIWGDTSPEGADFNSSYSVLSSAVLVDLIMTQFYSTMNFKFLKKQYRLLKYIGRFFAEYLVYENDKKDAVLIPSFRKYTEEDETFYAGRSDKKQNAVLKEMFASIVNAAELLEVSITDEDYVRFKSICGKLSAEETAEKPKSKKISPCSFNCDNFAVLDEVTDRIISSKVEDGKLEITILSDPGENFAQGELRGVTLKGNIFANISWENGKIKNAGLYTKPGHKFMEKLVICYKGRKYPASMKNNTMDILNILPTTV